MATFNKEPAPQEFSWTIQWKTWLSRQFTNLVAFLADPEFTSVTTETLVVEEDALFESNLQVEEDLSAEDAAFSGEVTIAEDLQVGGFIDGANSPVHVGPVTLSGTATVISDVIPSWARKITITVSGLSTNGTSEPLIQIGTSAGFEATTYNGSCSLLTDAGAVQVAAGTTGFIINSVLAANIIRATIVLSLHDRATNTWTASGTGNRGDAIRALTLHSEKALAGTLDRIRFTTVGGVNTFDAGAVSLRIEY